MSFCHLLCLGAILDTMPRLAINAASSTRYAAKRPDLYNAKRQIDSSRGLGPGAIKRLKDDEFWLGWRELVSQDVVDFVDNYEGRDTTGHPIREMNLADKLRLMESPARYFSRPQNVPERLRKQIYL